MREREKGAKALKQMASFPFFDFFGVGKGLLGWLIIQRGRHRLKYIEKGISKRNRLNMSRAH